jgi:predicted negative regulator of RcsB-dependent stress response
VSVYDTEEEQVEALKKWWNENGRSIVGGVVLGLGAVFGWQAWNQHQDQTAASASLRYEKMSQAVQAGNGESALKQGEKIIAEWPDSAYGVLAALDMARLKLDQGDAAGARTQYEWVLNQSQDSSLKQVARLRLARVLLSSGDLDGAEAVIAKADQDNYAGEFAVLRGDIATARKDYAAARTAYMDALTSEIGNRRLVRMKLDNLAADRDGK